MEESDQIPLKLYELCASSSENINQNPKKVCIVCTSMSPVDHSFEYLVFITDLRGGICESGGDEEVVASIVPTVRLDFDSFDLLAFCVVGSILYIFEGHPDKDNINGLGKSVLTYQLSDETSNLKLERSMLKEAPPMNGHKVSPKVTLTPDGNILVFSSVIRLYSPNEFDFELYEPEKKMWRKLPSLPKPDYHKRIHYFHIQSFTFMNKTVFFIRTNVGVFTLDLKLEKKLIWKTSAFRGVECIPKHLGDSFAVIGREICVIPHYAYDIRVRGTQHPGTPGMEDVFATLNYTFPEMSSFSDSDGYSDQSVGVILLNHQVKRDFSVCFLDAAINDETELPELMLQIYYCDLTKCRKELSAYRKKKVKESPIWWKRKRETFLLPGTSKIRSFKIVANANKSHNFHLCSFSPVGI